MKNFIYAFFALMVLGTSPAMADSKNGALSTVQAWISALNRSDLNGVVAAFASDARFFGTTTKTLITTPEGIRHYFHVVFEKYAPLSVELGEVTVSELSSDSAVLTGYDKWKVTIDGKSAEGIGRLSVAIARREGEWRIVSFHRSAMPN